MTYEDLTAAAEARHGLRAGILAAVIQTESGGRPYAFRFEPAFYVRYILGKHRAKLGGVWPHSSRTSEATERSLRAHSIGLMQVMGQVARELGFAGDDLAELVVPEIGIRYGAMHLANKIKRYGGDLAKGLSAYNAGSATEDNVARYVKPILARLV